MVAGGPVEEVEVVVVYEAWGVEDAFGGGEDATAELGGRGGGLEGAVVLGTEVDGL